MTRDYTNSETWKDRLVIERDSGIPGLAQFASVSKDVMTQRRNTE
jgi:hypothetical protein